MVNLGAIKNRGKTNKPRIEANANLEANLKLLIKPSVRQNRGEVDFINLRKDL